MKFDSKYSAAFLAHLRKPSSVVELHPKDQRCPFFCAEVAVETLRNSIEELQAIFNYQPKAVDMYFSTIGGEGKQLAALFLDMQAKRLTTENV